MIDALVKTVLSELKQISRTETVIGEPIRSEGVTLVPVSRISIGFGIGGGKLEGKDRGGEGTGGGISIEPVAFIVIREKKVEVLSVKKDSIGWGQIVELVPQALEKIRDLTGKKPQKPPGAGKEKK